MVTAQQLKLRERCFLLRKRKGMTLVEAAAFFEISQPYVYQAFELGVRKLKKPIDSGKLAELKTIYPRELCMIARRRAGLTQSEVAKRMGCSKLWLSKMENGTANEDRLAKWWWINYPTTQQVDW